MDMSTIIANLQGHQVVLTREIEEVSSDLTILQQMGSRYQSQTSVSLDTALHHLLLLKAEKEQLLFQVHAQLSSMQSAFTTSSKLVTELSSGGAGTPQLLQKQHPILSSVHPAHHPTTNGLGTGNYHNSANYPVSSPQRPFHTTTTAAVPLQYRSGVERGGFGNYSHIVHPILQASPDVVHLTGPGGLLVTTNSTILTHSPSRNR